MIKRLLLPAMALAVALSLVNLTPAQDKVTHTGYVTDTHCLMEDAKTH